MNVGVTLIHSGVHSYPCCVCDEPVRWLQTLQMDYHCPEKVFPLFQTSFCSSKSLALKVLALQHLNCMQKKLLLSEPAFATAQHEHASCRLDSRFDFQFLKNSPLCNSKVS